MSLYLVRLARGPRWDRARARREQADWAAHAAFMDALEGAGTIVAGGPLGEDVDAGDVLILVRAASEPAAIAVFDADPWQGTILTVVEAVRWHQWLGGLEPAAVPGRPSPAPRLPPVSPRHAPPGYDCPFCRVQRGEFDERNAASDIVAVTDRAYARLAPKWWPGNPGAALVMPRAHVENLYDIAPADGHAVWDLTQRVARAMREAYGCDGISTRQHNEPAGNQDVWHLHVHVFPRWTDDRLYERHHDAAWHLASERAAYADRLRAVLGLPTTFD